VPLADSVAGVAQGRQVLGQKDFRQGQSLGFWLQDQVLLHACRKKGNPSSTVTAVCSTAMTMIKTGRGMIQNLKTKLLAASFVSL
jgi:hypothetical protein